MAESIIQRFWSKTVAAQNGCVIWTAARHRGGYGFFGVDGRSVRAHRWIYESSIGPIGDRVLMHSCDTPSCVALQHLTPGTQAQNIADCVTKGRRHHEPRKSHCARGHEFTPDNTYIAKAGFRECNACRAMSRAKYRAKKAQHA